MRTYSKPSAYLSYSFPRAAENCSCKSLIFALADPSAQQCRLNFKARKKSLYRLTSFSPLVGKKFPLVGTIVSTCKTTKNTPQINLMLRMQSTSSMAKRWWSDKKAYDFDYEPWKEVIPSVTASEVCPTKARERICNSDPFLPNKGNNFELRGSLNS